MRTTIHRVRDLNVTDRAALERVIGEHLDESQQLVIQIVSVDHGQVPSQSAVPKTAELPEWCHVYAGLSDEEISAIEDSILQRANLTRPTE